MTALADAGWLNPLIGLLQGVQLGLLRLLAWLGLAGSSHGQPAWPWPLRLSGENLLIDLGQARRLALTLLVLSLVVLLLLGALVWRRRRWLLLGSVPLLLVLAPWPQAEVVLVPAYPTSFHRSPTGFSAASIAQGRALYAQHCVGCHGADGRGQGPLAAAQAVWPPNLAGPLLWRRADGDLLWHVLHGTKDRHGATTMPAFDRLADAEAWALIDFMKAQGAGQSLRATGVWSQPIGLPEVIVRCEGREPRPLSTWRGQRLRIVAAGSAAALPEDPRVVTVQLRPAASAAQPHVADCVADSPAAWEAFALIAGTDQLGGTQLLADRDGWLRARSAPGKAGWSEDDLLCRTAAGPGSAQDDPPPADGLGALIARMDAEPVRFLKGGFVH
ncbi:cytochrome c [Variovorax sp. J2P1-59]|uniref:c-type cytochrome n=1 Tax=Variovorax flavidus TaxID=3053501 RepID=UPI0025790DA3|nr:cytochrome c [Variovorax sp. J2P1-59]MDM0076829.1 cytochrome c [Variovorax sp. J2P1-59]